MPRDNTRNRARSATKAVPTAHRSRPCAFCENRSEWVDYKDTALLGRFMSDRGKIRARRLSGNCARHQRDVAIAIKSARELALLPYAQRTVNDRRTGAARVTAARRPRSVPKIKSPPSASLATALATAQRPATSIVPSSRR